MSLSLIRPRRSLRASPSRCRASGFFRALEIELLLLFLQERVNVETGNEWLVDLQTVELGVRFDQPQWRDGSQ